MGLRRRRRWGGEENFVGDLVWCGGSIGARDGR
jgi:hypothetical protein